MQDLVNGERRRAGLDSVLLDSALCSLADLKAKDMCDQGYFGHHSDALGTMIEMVESVLGIFPRIGENIAMNFCDEPTVHQAWMSSALHRKNILDAGYDRFGYGFVDLPDAGRIYVQVFIGGCD